MATTTAVVKRATCDDVALMPPPSLKRIKRPPKVLDEDDYTEALSEIIARDYFPGLEESRAQEEYLAALDSGNQAWIAQSSQGLRAIIDQKTSRSPRPARDNRYNSAAGAPRPPATAADTPRGFDGSQTPMSVTTEASTAPSKTDTSSHSLSSFQSKYTSEDNASFNDVLDAQNKTRREKHAYMWTSDQRLPSARQIAHRAREQRLLTEKEHSDAEAAKHGDKALIPLTTGATSSRSAKPDAWKIQRPDNTFMFFPDSVNETHPTAPTIQEQKELDSKAGPKETVHRNTRFPPLYSPATTSSEPHTNAIPPSPSLNTDILARRGNDDNASTYDGAATPRINGYAFVDEDEPDPVSTTTSTAQTTAQQPSYRDLLAGQVSSPFRFSTQTKREALHHRLVEKSASAKRAKERDAILDSTPVSVAVGATGLGAGDKVGKAAGSGNLTPAAARLLGRVGKTPVREKAERMSSREMWTPTPRRGRAGK